MDSTSVAYTIIAVGTLIFLAHLFSMIFSKKQIPDVFLLLLIGLLLGPTFGVSNPQDFGRVGSVFLSITLVVMLFEGGAEMSFKTLKNSWKGTVAITFTSFVALVIVIGTVAWLVMGLNPWASYLLGAILGGTSSAVVIPLVKQLKISKEVSTILILESAITDVLCIVVALAFMESFKASDTTPNVIRIVSSMLSSFIMATIIGAIGGLLWSSVLHKVRTIQTSMFLTPSFVFIIFGITEIMGFSGAIAALVLGVIMGNCTEINLSRWNYKPKKLNDNELSFIHEIVFILKTFFFVFVGISISFENVNALLWGIIVVVFIFATRIVITRLTAPKTSSAFEKTIISFMIPKGLAAAVLASIPETIPNFPNSTDIKYITYSVVLFSIFATSVMILITNRFPKTNQWYSKFLQKSEQNNQSADKSSPRAESQLPPETK